MNPDISSSLQAIPGDEIRQIFDQSHDGMLLTDEHGRLIAWNQAMAALSGIPAAIAIGRPIWETRLQFSILNGKADRFHPSLKESVEAILLTGQIPTPGGLETASIVFLDGSISTLQARMFSVQTGEGFRLGGVFRDVTESYQVNERLESLARFPSENPNPIMRISKSGKILFANEPSRPILEEWHASLGEMVPYEWIVLVREALSSGNKKQFDHHLRDQIFSVKLVPFQSLGYANIYMVEETHRIRAEVALRERENELASLYEMMPVGVCMTDEEGKFVYVNDMYCGMYGFRRDELIGRHFKMILPPEDIESGLSTFSGLLSGQTGLLPTLRRRMKKSGIPFYVEAYNSTLTRANGKRLLITAVNDVTQRVAVEEHQRQSEERNRRLAARLEWIAWLTRQISAVMDPPALYQLIVTTLQAETGCYAANLVLVEGDTAYRVAVKSTNPEDPFSGFSQPVGVGVIGRAAKSGLPQVVQDVTRDEDYFDGPNMQNVTSELAMPIKTGDRVLGVLDVQHNQPYTFDQTDLEAMGILADQLAVTLDNSRLFEETRQRTADLEGLVQASAALRSTFSRAVVLQVILQESIKLLKTEAAALILLDHNTQELQVERASGTWSNLAGKRVPPGWEVSIQALESSRLLILNGAAGNAPLILPELSAAQKCIALAPLIVSGLTIGVLGLGRSTPFTPYDASLINALSDMAAIVIHRETLHEQTLISLQRVSALHTVDMAINASLDMHFTLNVLLEQLTSQLGVDGACVLLMNSNTFTLEYAAARGFTSQAVTRVHLHMGEQLAGLAAAQRRQIRVPSPAGSPQYVLPPSLAAEGFKTYFGIPLIAKGQVKGVIELLHRSDYLLDSERIEFLETLADQAAIAIDNAELFENLQVSNAELSMAYDATIEGWSKAMDLRDQETAGHTQRVTEIIMRLAREMGINDQEIMHLRRGALLHDIGKMGIPDSVLHKPGPLTNEEWLVMRRHPEYAYDLLAPIAFLYPAIDIPYCHHEKWDGSGYPRKLKGEQIPLAARIFAVVDVWDALLSDRPYRPAWPEKDVLQYIREQAGSHFDPRVVEVFLKFQEEQGPFSL